ncbi:MAG: hypothetical protein AAFR87_24855 [Bacteroidota bacterium]
MNYRLLFTTHQFILASLILLGCNAGLKYTPKEPKIPPRDQITMGNGENSYIISDGFEQDGATFTFKEIKIEGNGWLVMHPFKDGKPHGTVYVGATYVRHGKNKNVSITVDDMPVPQENYILMLHWDINQNKVFDFGDGINVPDAPLFEGTKMIALQFQAKP